MIFFFFNTSLTKLAQNPDDPPDESKFLNNAQTASRNYGKKQYQLAHVCILHKAEKRVIHFFFYIYIIIRIRLHVYES